ncbi:unnamed protein product [Lactuca saligna]|uniref:Terpene synthase N-terminal domain-containing protein n=1 Tax=Lactuca saligna TaxID=75948 RepID=A0AA36EL50_LACSI|nr:unnamed protein product [Lactuca saligna]
MAVLWWQKGLAPVIYLRPPLSRSDQTEKQQQKREKERIQAEEKMSPKRKLERGNDYTSRADTLIDAVKSMIWKVSHSLSTLELIDDLHRRGISYHFVDDISHLLDMIYHNYYQTQDKWDRMDLKLKALVLD